MTANEEELNRDRHIYSIPWTPHAHAADDYASLSGLDALRKIVAGELANAPFAAILGLGLAEIEHGRAVFAVDPGEHHYNPMGIVHGGLAATLIDSASGCAVYSTLGAEDRWSTIDLTVNFIRPMTASTGKITCVGTLIHAGGRIATADGRVTDAEGRLLAHGLATCLIQRAGSGNSI